MIEVPLTQGQVALVDDEDKWVLEYNWQAVFDPKVNSYYARRHLSVGRKILMHREILSANDSVLVDHVNHNTLDNRRHNIRLATPHQNGGNKSMQSNNTSGYAGVTWSKDKNKWKAQISIDGKNKHIGYYSNVDQAHEMYKQAHIDVFGEFSVWQK